MSQYRFKLKLNNKTFYGFIRNWRDFFPAIRVSKKYRTRLPVFTYEEVVFVKGAKTYIDELRLTYGPLAKVTIALDMYNIATLTWEPFITGKLGMDRVTIGSVTTSVGVDPEDFITKWLNNDEVVLNLNELKDLEGNAITAFGDELVTITMQGDILTLTYQAQATLDQWPVNASQYPSNPQAGPEDYYWQFTPHAVQIDDLKITNYNLPTAWNESIPVNGYRLEEDGEVTIHFVGTIEPGLYGENGYDLDAVPKFRIWFRLNDDDPTPIALHNFPQTSLNDRETTEIVEDELGDYTFSGSKGDEFAIYYHFEVPSGSDRPKVEIDAALDWGYQITQDTVADDTECDGLLVYEAALRMLQKMTGRNDPLRSNLLGRTDSEVHTYAEDGKGSLRLYTNGRHVRQFPTEDYPIQGEFYELIKAIHADECIGVGVITIDEIRYIAIEPIEFFWNKDNVAFSIFNPSELEESCAVDYLFSHLKSGNDKYELEKYGTLDTPHAPRNHTTGLESVTKNTYDISQPAVQSSPLIEQLRRDKYKANGKNRDNRYDNSVVLIDLVRDGGGYRPEKGADLTDVNNLLNSDYHFNLRHTPRRALQNHLKWIKGGGIAKETADPGEIKIRFVSGEGKLDVYTEVGGSGYTEDADIDYNEGDDPLFIPNEITFKYPLTNAQMKSIVADPNQAIEVTYRGRTFKAFIEVDIENFDSKNAGFKGLEAYE